MRDMSPVRDRLGCVLAVWCSLACTMGAVDQKAMMTKRGSQQCVHQSWAGHTVIVLEELASVQRPVLWKYSADVQHSPEENSASQRGFRGFLLWVGDHQQVGSAKSPDGQTKAIVTSRGSGQVVRLSAIWGHHQVWREHLASASVLIPRQACSDGESPRSKVKPGPVKSWVMRAPA